MDSASEKLAEENKKRFLEQIRSQSVMFPATTSLLFSGIGNKAALELAGLTPVYPPILGFTETMAQESILRDIGLSTIAGSNDATRKLALDSILSNISPIIRDTKTNRDYEEDLSKLKKQVSGLKNQNENLEKQVVDIRGEFHDFFEQYGEAIQFIVNYIKNMKTRNEQINVNTNQIPLSFWEKIESLASKYEELAKYKADLEHLHRKNQDEASDLAND